MEGSGSAAKVPEVTPSFYLMMLRHQVLLVLTDVFLESTFYMDLCKLVTVKLLHPIAFMWI